MLIGNEDEESLLPRPLTPPRETNRLGITITSDPFNSPTISHLPSPARSSPTSSAESTASSTKKQVHWSGFKQFYPPVNSDNTSIPRVTRQSPLNLTKPKSILKVTAPTSHHPQAEVTYASFGEMLESAVQALASSERSKKQDTYASLANTLKAYDSVENLKNVADKMGLLVDFIRRDISSMVPETGGADIQLNKNALRLLTVFAWTPMLCEAIPDDDAIFFYQYATSMVEKSTSKNTVMMCLYLLSQQRFPARVVTLEQANRIMTTLDTLNDRHIGSALTHDRIGIYMNLLIHARSMMISRAEHWMDHLVEAFFNSVVDIRIRAILFATDAAKSIGSEKQVSRTLDKVFASSLPNSSEKKFVVVSAKLKGLLELDAAQAAQVWGAITSLLHGLTVPIEKWQFYASWINLLAGCFNSSDTKAKYEAHAAWSRLICLVNITKDTDEKNFDLLVRPIAAFLDEKKPKTTKVSRTAAMDSFCTLLYYGFRPDAHGMLPVVVWKKLIESILVENIVSVRYGTVEGCVILRALLDGTARPWSDTRPLEGTAIKTDDLPRLEPKWVRSHSALMFQTLERLFLKTGYWDLEEYLRAELSEVWATLLRTIAKAASKEVRTSSETMEAVANLVQMLSRIWTSDTVNMAHDRNGFMAKFTNLITKAMDALGPMAFTEKKLSNDGHNNFALVTTPSGRSSSGSNILHLHTPILHFFQLFIQPRELIKTDEAYWGKVEVILSKCVNTRDSRRKKLEVLVDAKNILPLQNIRKVHLSAWEVLADLSVKSLPLRKDRGLASPSPPGPEFDDVVSILEWSCIYGDASSFLAWNKLYQEFYSVVLSEYGEAYVTNAVLEPLARVLRRQRGNDKCVVNLLYGKGLMEKVTFSKSKPNLDKIQRTLYGQPWRKSSSSLDPLDEVYSMISLQLQQSYDVRDELSKSENVDILLQYLGALQLLLMRTPATSLPTLLIRIQDGISVWPAIDKPGASALVTKILEVWQTVLKALTRLAPTSFDSVLLRSIGTLIASGLESKRKGVVNTTLDFWNETFGKQASLDYPSRVQKILHRLRLIANVNLPTFPEIESGDTLESPPKFSETQDEDCDHELMSTPTPNAPRLLNIKAKSKNSLSPGEASDRSSSPGRRVPKPKIAKLKHMDSQINFEPIETDEAEFESQLLTDRQREVKERQTGSGALFKDIDMMTPPSKSSTRSRRSVLSPPVEVSPPVTLQLRVPTPQKDEDDQAISPVSPLKAIEPSLGFVALPSPELPSAKISELEVAEHIDDQGLQAEDDANLPSSPPPAVENDSEVPEEPMFKDVVTRSILSQRPNTTGSVREKRNNSRESEDAKGVVKETNQNERLVFETAHDEMEDPAVIQSNTDDAMVIEEPMMLPAKLAEASAIEEFFTLPEDSQQLYREESESNASFWEDNQSSQVSPLSTSQRSPASSQRGRNRVGPKRKRAAKSSQDIDDDEKEFDCIIVASTSVTTVSPPAKKKLRGAAQTLSRESPYNQSRLNSAGDNAGTSAPSNFKSMPQPQSHSLSLATPESEAKNAAAQSQEETPATRAARNRRAAAVSFADNTVTPPRRRPGRPKKEERQDVSIIDSSTEPRRRPGRPRKEESQDVGLVDVPIEDDFEAGHAAMEKVMAALREMEDATLSPDDVKFFKKHYWKYAGELEKKYEHYD